MIRFTSQRVLLSDKGSSCRLAEAKEAGGGGAEKEGDNEWLALLCDPSSSASVVMAFRGVKPLLPPKHRLPSSVLGFNPGLATHISTMTGLVVVELLLATVEHINNCIVNSELKHGPFLEYPISTNRTPTGLRLYQDKVLKTTPAAR